MQEYPSRTIPAHELFGDLWLNSMPVAVTAMRGNVVLLYFWDFACGACLETLLYVQEWFTRYRPSGLVVVGIHAPKFPFSKDLGTVQQAVHRLHVQFPVVVDNGLHLWSRYGNRAWPTLVLIDKDGFVRYQLEGAEGSAALERSLRVLVMEANPLQELPDPTEPIREADRMGAIRYRCTGELFAGYGRGSVGNVEGYIAEAFRRYSDPELYMDGRFYLKGKWFSGRDSVWEENAPEEPNQVVLSYGGREVSAVLGCRGEGLVEITVRQDEQYLTKDSCGEDIHIEPDGASVLVVDEPRLYNVVKNQESGEHLLRLRSRKGGLELYAFSFVAGVIPEPISRN